MKKIVWMLMCLLIIIPFVYAEEDLGEYNETAKAKAWRIQYTENINKWIEHQRALEIEKAKLAVVLEKEILLQQTKEANKQEVNIYVNNENNNEIESYSSRWGNEEKHKKHLRDN